MKVILLLGTLESPSNNTSVHMSPIEASGHESADALLQKKNKLHITKGKLLYTHYQMIQEQCPFPSDRQYLLQFFVLHNNEINEKSIDS